MAYSLDFRKKVLSTKEKEKLSFEAITKRFDVGIASVIRWSKNIVPKKTRNKPATKIDMNALKKDIELHPDAYYYERAERLGVSRSGIWSAVKRLSAPYKKRPRTSK